MIAVIIVAIVILALYLYGTRTFDYWEKRGVKHDKPFPFFGNNLKGYLMQKSMTQIAVEQYEKYPNERVVGFFRSTMPELVIRDPEIIKRILTTDFNHFHYRGFIIHKELDAIEPTLRNLFFADGDLWRLLRQRMTPAFSSGRLRAMFPLVVERAERLQARTLRAAAAGQPLDARDLMARYTTDFIGACGFGLDADSLNNENSEFRKLGAKILNPTLKRMVVSVLKNIVPYVFKYCKFLGQEVEDDIVNLTRQIRKQRGFKPSGRNDFIDFMMEWQLKGKMSVESIEKVRPDGSPEVVELELDDTLMAAQAFIFFVAGFETSSSATSFTLHQLAYHPEVQRRAQADIDRVLRMHNNKLSYDAIKEMTYLEWVFLEGMRMFPPSGFLMRQCVRRYTFPGTDVTIDPGVKVTIPILALHNDPKYFDNPTEFRPERFSPEEVANRHKFVYLPFGEGPRACIGARLGHMQSLAGLAAVLARLTVRPAAEGEGEGERGRELRTDPRSNIVQSIVGGIPLLFTERKPRSTVTLDTHGSRSL